MAARLYRGEISLGNGDPVQLPGSGASAATKSSRIEPL
jgi:hypothetical protein